MTRLMVIASLVLLACGTEGTPPGPGGGGKADDPAAADASPEAVAGQRARVTCDFGTDPFDLGTLEFAVDLASHVVPTSCPDDDQVNCVLDGPNQDLTLMAVDTWEEGDDPTFGGDQPTVRRIIITGSNGDDIELTIYVSYDPSDAAAVLIINDGQFVNGLSEIVPCTSSVP